jgi:two-component system OmpR family response regulator
MSKLLRVLVVDDNPDIVDTLMTLVRLEGHDCRPCYHGHHVLPYAADYDPDVILLDIGLPGKSGWEIAIDLQARNTPKRPLLIAITGEYTKGTDKTLAETCGFDYYLVKPADPKVLLQLLAAARQLKPNE